MSQPFVMPWLPVARIVTIPGRGEFFARHHVHPDPGAPTVLLLHGWTASADLQFFTAYEALAEHCSFIAIDHQGHGRGLRTPAPFQLDDVADDAALVAQQLGAERVVVVGYSMGGPIALTIARRHPALVAGIVVQATALEWNATWRERLRWRGLPIVEAVLRSRTYPRFMRRFLESMLSIDSPLNVYLPWIRGELQRNDTGTILEAGRSLSRFDATSWAPGLGVPAAMLLTTKDRLVKPAKQRRLAAALGADVREVAADHLAAWEAPTQFGSVTVELVELVTPDAPPG